MKRTLLATFSLLLVLTFTSCKEGEIISKDFTVDNTYNTILVDGAFDVIIDTLATQITVTCGEKIMPKVKIKTQKEMLRISFGFNARKGDVRVVLPYNENLSDIRLDGAAFFKSQQIIKAQQIGMRLNGASQFVGDLDADKITVTMDGASNIGGWIDTYDLTLKMNGASKAQLDGFAEQLYLNFDGASELVEMIVDDRYSLECNICDATLNGASNAYIHCNDRINSNVDESSELHYTGYARVRGYALHEVL